MFRTSRVGVYFTVDLVMVRMGRCLGQCNCKIGKVTDTARGYCISKLIV
jgi:hypothetical protein